jgi:hypothetical protein
MVCGRRRRLWVRPPPNGQLQRLWCSNCGRQMGVSPADSGALVSSKPLLSPTSG